MFYKSIYATLFVIIISPSISVHAEHDGFEGHDHESRLKVDKDIHPADVSVSAGEVVIVVHGIVCSFCSQGVIRNLSNLSFIDQSKYTKGVKVEIEDQRVTIAIKPDGKLNLIDVSESILNGGYEPIEAYVSDANGNVTLHDLQAF